MQANLSKVSNHHTREEVLNTIIQGTEVKKIKSALKRNIDDDLMDQWKFLKEAKEYIGISK